jgi:hypothetical protein
MASMDMDMVAIYWFALKRLADGISHAVLPEKLVG